MAWTWLILAIALIVLELFTYQFVSIWFAAGALITTLFTAIFQGLDIWWQILIFVVSSLGFLFATRPLVRKILAKRGKAHETNLELVLGKDAVVVFHKGNVRVREGDAHHGAAHQNAAGLFAEATKGENIRHARSDGNEQVGGA